MLVVEFGGYGDDPAEEVGDEAQVLHLGLPLNVVLPQGVTPEQWCRVSEHGQPNADGAINLLLDPRLFRDFFTFIIYLKHHSV